MALVRKLWTVEIERAQDGAHAGHVKVVAASEREAIQQAWYRARTYQPVMSARPVPYDGPFVAPYPLVFSGPIREPKHRTVASACAIGW